MCRRRNSMRKLLTAIGILIIITGVTTLFQSILIGSFIRMVIATMTFSVGVLIIKDARNEL